MRAEAEDLPFVSVLMPVRNERTFIVAAVGSVLRQEYPPERMEVFVIDGLSDDGTPDMVRALATARGTPVPQLHVVENHGRTAPAALNVGLRLARGDVIARVDGHCEIDASHIRRCVGLLRETGAACVGGRVVAVGDTLRGRAIALAQSSPFGVGRAGFRTGRSSPGPVETVAFGVYRRDVFTRFGTFDEELPRVEDGEFNQRLIQAGEKIWLDPSIRCVYRSRTTLRGLWRQYFAYGSTKVRMMQKRRAPAAPRQVVPPLFVVALASVSALAIITRRPAWLLLVAVPYGLVNLIGSAIASRLRPSGLLVPVAFAVMHLAWGTGFLIGLWRWRHGFR